MQTLPTNLLDPELLAAALEYQNSKILFQSYGYDDVLVVSRHSNVHPSQAITKTRLTKELEINIPVLSAAMSTVTESRLSIALARLGGVGFIHMNMSITEQARQVAKVKRADHGVILDPITIKKDRTIGYARELMRENNINGLVVVDAAGNLKGILTRRDVRGKRENTTVSSAMTKKVITVPLGTDMTEAKKILEDNKIEKLPVMKGTKVAGLITLRDISKIEEFPNAIKDNQGQLLAGAAVGVTDDVIKRVRALVRARVDVICIDSSHGDTEGVIYTLRKIKKNFPKLQVIVGNVATAGAAERLIQAGADAIKVGIGPGSICSTRQQLGVGVGQVTAIMMVVSVARKYNIPVIADGGIKELGDISKAIVAGADTVMIGMLLARTDEAPGEVIKKRGGLKFKKYFGMGSLEGMAQGSAHRYFRNKNKARKGKVLAEGVSGTVPYFGPLQEMVGEMMEALTGAMGHTGSRTIAEHQINGYFNSLSSGVVEESRVRIQTDNN